VRVRVVLKSYVCIVNMAFVPMAALADYENAKGSRV
jgi:hypothetical protein